MKTFRFKLQTLLDQRRRREDVLQVELAEIIREEAKELNRLAELESRRAELQARRAKLERRNAAVELQMDEYAQALRDDIKVQHLTVDAVRERLEAKRAEVLEAMKARKVIEALRDKQQRDYILAIARAEQSMLDEMASLKHARAT